MTVRGDLYVISTDRRDVYELLKKRLGERAGVEIVFDRRIGERRSQAPATKKDRRRVERRSADERYYLLKSVGIIHVSASRRASGEDEDGRKE